MAIIAVLGTFDTKGPEHAYVGDLIRKSGHEPLLIDVGITGDTESHTDITCEEVAAETDLRLDILRTRRDRGEAVTAMAEAAAKLIRRLADEGRIQGIISLGGSGGTAIATAAMRTLPIGFPKVMVSTMAGGNVAPYVDVSDITMIPSIVDVAGLNRISRLILARAAGAVCGMTSARPEARSDRRVIAASMFGNTTECVEHAKQIMESEGYEVIVFHATGSGGRSMECLIESGLIAGVLDLTTTEWADEVVGGVLSAGPKRLEAAAKTGTPAVVAPGCLDMVNFQEPKSIPEKFRDRLFYPHNPQVTLMRTSPEESAEIAHAIARKLNASTGPVTVAIPRNGLSVIGASGKPFADPAADLALTAGLRKHLREDIEILELDAEINDPAFAELCARALLRHLNA